jgi:murein DD-endopeptidase MepM/ murein hydrolase activator NlpD
VDLIRAWIEANPEAIARILDLIKAAADGVATAFEGLSKWLVGDDQMGDKLERMAAQAERFAAAWKGLLSFLDPLLKIFTEIERIMSTGGIAQLSTMALRGMGIVPPETASGGSPGTSADTRNAWQRNAPTWLGGKEAPGPTGGTPSVSSADSLTRLVEVEAAKAGIDPRIMHGIRAGESGKRQNGSNPAAAYDRKDDAVESSWGPFQLNRRKGLGVQFEKETGLDVRDPATIPDQVRWVAEGLKKNGRKWLGNWMGYRGDRDADPRWGDSGYVPSTSARAQGSGVEGGIHPLDGAGRISSDFGMRTHPILGGRRMHAGIDIAAQAGTNVKSMTEGLVSIGASGDVTVKNPDGSSRTYRHVVPNVADGARVAAGQVIAQLRAHDSRSTGPHLHLEARDKDGNLMDPKALLRPPAAVARDRSNVQPAAAPNMSPGGFDPNSIKPSTPAGIGPGATSNATSNDNRAVHQTFHSTMNMTGVERPTETAAAVGRVERDNHALAIANAQRAIA